MTWRPDTECRVFSLLCRLALVCHELCNHRCQAGGACDVFSAGYTEMNPARVESIDHLGARLGPAFRHALADEEFRPLLTRDGNRFDGASKSAAQCSCNIVGGILLGTGNLNIPSACPLLTQDIRPGLANVSRGNQREFTIQRIKIREDPSL